MNYLLIFFCSLLLLSWCSYTNQKDTEMVHSKEIITVGWFQPWDIIHTSLPTTWTIEVYYGSNDFNLFKNLSWCVVDMGGMAESQRTYCNSISWYNHIYEIPSLNIKYYYQSQMMFNYISGGYNRFLREDGWFNPMVVSGDMLSWIDNDSSYLYKQIKSVNDSPQDVIDSIKLGSWCKFTTVPLGMILSWYQIYTVPSYAYLWPETIPTGENRCLVGLYDVKDGSTWAYIFSPNPKDYYYTVVLNGWGTIPSIYTDASLKLFLE